MGREVIQCEYCHTLITEKDIVCPKCGANCSEQIKKYKEEENKKIEENEKMVKDLFKKNSTFVRVFGIIIFIIGLVIFFMIFKTMMDSNKKRDNTIKSLYNTNPVEEVKDVYGKYNEVVESDDIKVIVDSYELFEYHSDHFEKYNTPDGYQKIAFHFSITNKSSNDIYTIAFISLTADNTAVEGTKIELDNSFAELVTGKERYDSIENLTISKNDTLNGYIGFLVPTDKKELRFKIGKNIYITMDNPAYLQ